MSGFQGMLYSVCGILITVIMIGSILVIYNSFAISVSERKKQFGMLSSVGATKKQIKKSVLYEGLVLGMIGIPIGIISGICGIGITLRIVNNLLKPMIMEEGMNWNLHLVISWESIIIAAVLIGITIYLSVMLPARRASKISEVEAIRGNDEIKIKAKKLKTRKFIRRWFGIEGELALKNLKRSKKKYRTTVISLMISIILFVSVSGFVGYMYSGFDAIYQSVDYDYSISVYASDTDTQKQEEKQLSDKLENSKNIDKLTIVHQVVASTLLTEDRLDTNMQKAIKEKERVRECFYKEEDKYQIGVRVIALNDKQMEEYLKQIGITKIEDNQVILINYIDLLRTAKMEGNLTNLKQKEMIELAYGVRQKNNKNLDEVTYETHKKWFEIAKVTNKMPFGLVNQDNPSLIAITTKKGLESLETQSFMSMMFTAKYEKELEEELKEIEKANMQIQVYVENVKQTIQAQRNTKLIINIFLYGFIALISAIGIANIFNTISTNINLRKREFAMLKSIGMTDKGFKKMLDLECIFYGTKALLFGLPIGILICYFLNQGFGNAIEFAFYLPWSSIIISIISVYAVVFFTMLYASRKNEEREYY
ncbi:MAG: ABC transporter permease [Clostridia bacterium]|nr:ABC transporter permease [Clostridia bacterium]